MGILVPTATVDQPEAYSLKGRNELTVAIASLSLGGAERIVLDWANRIYPRWNIHLIVLRDREKEWKVPPHVRVTRLQSDPRFQAIVPRLETMHLRRLQYLRLLGAELAQSSIPVCACHLLSEDERSALGSLGASIVTVLHNAKEGWSEDPSHLNKHGNTIAVSDACVRDLRDAGFEGPTSVIRHIPPRRKFAEDARERYRRSWNIPENATVVGMVGAIKVQKNYRRALLIFKALLKKRDAYLVIVGGPVNVREEGKAEWRATVKEIEALGLRSRVAMPGFVSDAAHCLPAFDIVLNTSDYEGMSIATLEALQSGLPVVASKVGGQGEIQSEGLVLIPSDSDIDVWVEALDYGLGKKFQVPQWSQFPSYRLWTLFGLARPVTPSGKTLFVTSNLNSGGAQRSLVNLTTHISGSTKLEVCVAGDSTSSYFYHQLLRAGVPVSRTTDQSDAFSHAEALVHKICAEQIGTVCFWNVDRRVKLLVVKALGWTSVRFIDVSPGGYSFEEIDGVAYFQQLIAFTGKEYYQRLDTLVLKYDGPYPAECEGKTVVIKNGVLAPREYKREYTLTQVPRIVVNGRIAPSKFLDEIIEAMRIVRESIPNAELHIFGGAEVCEQEYLDRISGLAYSKLGKSAHFYGTNFEVTGRLKNFDAYVVLGKHQGCPNALLEALSVGLPVVANDDGGTREQVIDNVTGLLVAECSPEAVAKALIRILTDRQLAKRIGENGRNHVLKYFSMREMSEHYLQLLGYPLPPTNRDHPITNTVSGDHDEMASSLSLA